MLKFENIQKKFGNNLVLKGINLEIKKGEFVALIGASGCGKTTLIRTVNGFVVPDGGRVIFENEEIDYKNSKKLRQIRKKVGMIYQLFNLVERTNSLHNVLTGVLGKMDQGIDFFLSLIGFFGKENKKKALELMEFVGIRDKSDTRVDKLSGGQKQRVAVARALMQEPHLLLADEPIANLDPKAAKKLLDLLKEINQKKGITIVTVLHHIDFIKTHFNRIVAIKEGEIVFDGKPEELSDNLLEYIYGVEIEEALEWATI